MCIDESKPHVLCYLSSGVSRTCDEVGDFKDEDLLTSEVWTILNHSITKMKLEGQAHRVIPVCSSTTPRGVSLQAHDLLLKALLIPFQVTIISCVGWQGRIVQGFVSERPGSSKYVINFRKTKLISLYSSTDQRANFMRMLAWLVGEPVGNTT